MRSLALVLASLALLSVLPAPAQAQLSASVVITLEAPTEALTADSTLTIPGTVAYTADFTAWAGVFEIPVTYYVEDAPAWATVIISPANDVFPAPGAPMAGFSYTVVRMISVTVTAGEAPPGDASDSISIMAIAHPHMGGQAASGVGAVPVRYDAADEPCHELTDEEMLAMAREAANEYVAKNGGTGVGSEAPNAAPAQGGSDELHVQTRDASPLSLPWIAVAGFALVGAGVGLVLRRRLGR